MSALARFFHQRGDTVCGYDRTPSPLTDRLQAEGIDIHFDDNPDRLPADIDLVVYTPAVPTDTLEFQALVQRGVKRVRFFDVSKTHPSYVIASIFRYSHLVIASPTYNLGIYPTVHNLIDDMKNLHIQNRTISIIENGSWAPKSGSLIAKELEGLDNITYLGDPITVKSSVNDETRESLIALGQAIADDIYEKKNK